MKSHISDFLPPIIFRFLTRFRQPSITKQIFQNYNKAILNSPSNYEEKLLVESVIQKSLAFKKDLKDSLQIDLASLRTLVGLAAVNENELKVIDFGGGGGFHYFISKLVLGESIKLKWAVIETPTFVRYSKILENSDLKFFDDISIGKKFLGNVDLVFTSSALQYCPDPIFTLESLVNLNAKHIFITRTPFVEDSETFTTIQVSKLSQNGPGKLVTGYKDKDIFYPVTFVNDKKILKVLEKKYKIRFIINEGSEGFRFKNKDIKVKGYFCDLKKL